MIHRTKIEIRTELLIKKHHHGIKLVRPHQRISSAQTALQKS